MSIEDIVNPVSIIRLMGERILETGGNPRELTLDESQVISYHVSHEKLLDDALNHGAISATPMLDALKVQIWKTGLMPYVLLTSNEHKYREFKRKFCSKLIIAKGEDIKEVDSDPLTVAKYKSIEAGEGTVVEDTVLIVDGKPVVDIRYKLNEIDQLNEETPCVWQTTLAVNDGVFISIYQGRTFGHLVPSRKGEEGFGFDPYFIPIDCNETLSELERDGKKDNYSARILAVNCFNADIPLERTLISSIPPWNGPYQG